MALSGNAITFTPVEGFSGVDRFTYTISDGCNTVTGSVMVIVVDAADSAANRIGDIIFDTAGARVRFAAIPGFTYNLERSTNAVVWLPLTSVTAPEAGLIDFLDTDPPSGPVYYRTIAP